MISHVGFAADTSLTGWAAERVSLTLACGLQPLLPTRLCPKDGTWPQSSITKAAKECQAEIKSKVCQDYIKENPEFHDSLRSCTEGNICQETRMKDFSSENCARGFLLGTGEAIHGLASVISAGASKVVENFAQEQKNIHSEKRIQENRLKLAEIYVWRGQKPEAAIRAVAKLPSATLQAETQQYEYLKKTAERQNSKWPRFFDPLSSAETNENTVGVLLEKFLAEQGVRIQCLDLKTRTELMCWGAAYLVDPVMVAGLAVKGGKIASLVMSKLRQSAPRAGTPVGFVESRNFTTDIAKPSVMSTRKIDLPILPSSMRLTEDTLLNGKTTLNVENTVKMPDGSFQISTRQVAMDPLTGVIDANFPGGREFRDLLIKEKQGKVALVVVDLDNVGFVNREFTNGAEAKGISSKRQAAMHGDDYIKAVAQELKSVVGDQGVVFRTGGDEFHLVLNETDPQKVKTIIDQLNRRVRSEEVQKIFSNEAKARAEAFRAETSAQGGVVSSERAEEYRLRYAAYSQPNISTGSIIVNGEDIPQAIEKAEQQLFTQKLETKSQYAADMSKKGGTEPSKGQKPKLGYVPRVEIPLQGNGTAAPTSAALKEGMARIPQTREKPLFRVGEYTVVPYKEGLNKQTFQLETYQTGSDGTRVYAPRELFINDKTGLIDYRAETSKELVTAFVKNEKTPDRGMVWVNAENLGMVNYFEGGSQAGDQLLKSVADVIRRTVNDTSIPMKMQGSEFLIATEKIPPKDLAKFEETVRKALMKDPAVQRVYQNERRVLQRRYQEAASKGEDATAQKAKLALEKLAKAQENLFSVHSTSLRPGDDMSTVMGRTRRQRYND